MLIYTIYFIVGSSSYNSLISEQHLNRNGIQRPVERVMEFVHRVLKAIYNLITFKNVQQSPSSLFPGRLEEEEVSPFLNLPSTPKSKNPNINIGKIYAQNKLKEIESYLSKKRTLSTARKYSVNDADSNRNNSQVKRSVDDLSKEELMGKRLEMIMLSILYIIKCINYIILLHCLSEY